MLKALYARAKTLAKHKLGLDLVPNPFFVLNGICDADDDNSPVTASYLRGRLGKSLASTAQGFATGALKTFTVVDPASMAMAGVSIGSTIAHMVALSAIAQKWQNSHDDHGLDRLPDEAQGSKARQEIARGDRRLDPLYAAGHLDRA